MSKVLIYMRGSHKCYAVVAPNGVKPYRTSKKKKKDWH